MKRFTVFIFAALSLTAYGSTNSPYIAKVYDYRPAPGQFINTIPEYEDGDTQADINAKCEEYLVGQAKGGLVCLGAFGGYIIFSFDHPVQNKPGEYDFKIYGNAFNATGYSTAGSSEPGIVLVSIDANHNGLPDDEWFELAGSDYYKSSTLYNYEITYARPSGNEPDATYIHWTSNDPTEPEGYISRNTFHRQSYWPEWITENELKFSATRLAKNAYTNDYGQFMLRALDWGYADNRPNDEDPGFNLENAVDRNGNPVSMEKADFIKVYTGINQYCGDLGETSTEIMGAEDLHPDYAGTTTIIADADIRITGCNNGILQISNAASQQIGSICDLQGRVLQKLTIKPGYEIYDISQLAPGMYMLRCSSNAYKFLR